MLKIWALRGGLDYYYSATQHKEAQNSFSLSVFTEQPLDARHFAKR